MGLRSSIVSMDTNRTAQNGFQRSAALDEYRLRCGDMAANFVMEQLAAQPDRCWNSRVENCVQGVWEAAG